MWHPEEPWVDWAHTASPGLGRVKCVTHVTLGQFPGGVSRASSSWMRYIHPVGPSAGPPPPAWSQPCALPDTRLLAQALLSVARATWEPQTWLLWFSVMILFTMTCSYPEASFTPESPPLAKATLPPTWLQGPKGAGHGLQWTVPQPEPILRTDTDAELSLPQ